MSVLFIFQIVIQQGLRDLHNSFFCSCVQRVYRLFFLRTIPLPHWTLVIQSHYLHQLVSTSCPQPTSLEMENHKSASTRLCDVGFEHNKIHEITCKFTGEIHRHIQNYSNMHILDILTQPMSKCSVMQPCHSVEGTAASYGSELIIQTWQSKTFKGWSKMDIYLKKLELALFYVRSSMNVHIW